MKTKNQKPKMRTQEKGTTGERPFLARQKKRREQGGKVQRKKERGILDDTTHNGEKKGKKNPTVPHQKGAVQRHRGEREKIEIEGSKK